MLKWQMQDSTTLAKENDSFQIKQQKNFDTINWIILNSLYQFTFSVDPETKTVQDEFRAKL